MICKVVNWGIYTYTKNKFLGGFKYKRQGIWLKKEFFIARDVSLDPRLMVEPRW